MLQYFQACTHANSNCRPYAQLTETEQTLHQVQVENARLLEDRAERDRLREQVADKDRKLVQLNESHAAELAKHRNETAAQVEELRCVKSCMIHHRGETKLICVCVFVAQDINST